MPRARGKDGKTATERAIEWKDEDPDNRTDAQAARKFGLLSAASICRKRKMMEQPINQEDKNAE